MKTKISDRRALMIVMSTVVFFLIGILHVRANATVMLITSGFVTIALAMMSGVGWEELNDDICQNISAFVPGLLIILAVGMIVGSWIISGTIPLMIYYGLKILTPSWFLVSSFFICIVISVTTGTSWGTISTVGVALMGVSQGLGIPLPIQRVR